MKILIADDHTIVREGIRMLLADAYPAAEITDVADAAELVRKASKQKWDVVVCDISMPPGDSGLEALKQIREYAPATPVIVLSMYTTEQYALRAIRAGASGYLTKDAATFELVTAVKTVLSGKRYLSSEVAGILADAFADAATGYSVKNLTDREFEVFRLLAAGKSISDIAKQLILSVNTISTFRARIFEKMGFQNNTELIRFAIDNKLI
ncbi:response regulator transcription factor [Sediminibacterium sp. WSJ-3]|nr:response regulator transcription factor [Sediminibacterium soli]